jgi:hypothetical protein
MLITLPSPHLGAPAHLSTLQSATSQGACLNSLFFCYFHFRFTFESIKEVGSVSKTMQFSIDLIDETPIYHRRHRLSKHEWELIDERCK